MVKTETFEKWKKKYLIFHATAGSIRWHLLTYLPTYLPTYLTYLSAKWDNSYRAIGQRSCVNYFDAKICLFLARQASLTPHEVIIISIR